MSNTDAKATPTPKQLREIAKRFGIPPALLKPISPGGCGMKVDALTRARARARIQVKEFHALFDGPAPTAPYSVDWEAPSGRDLHRWGYAVRNRHGHLIGAFVQEYMALRIALHLATVGESEQQPRQRETATEDR